MDFKTLNGITSFSESKPHQEKVGVEVNKQEKLLRVNRN